MDPQAVYAPSVASNCFLGHICFCGPFVPILGSAFTQSLPKRSPSNAVRQQRTQPYPSLHLLVHTQQNLLLALFALAQHTYTVVELGAIIPGASAALHGAEVKPFAPTFVHMYSQHAIYSHLKNQYSRQGCTVSIQGPHQQ